MGAKNTVTFDYTVVGSGFGGSVSAMRLSEKGYKVFVLERGKRYRDQDFPRTNWIVWKFLWMPALRCFGIFELSPMECGLMLHGSGVGGGSLVYANVLEVPDDALFENPSWKNLADWKNILKPHYETARRMLGVTVNPKLSPADDVLKKIAEDLGQGQTFRPTNVGVFFGPEGKEVPDPYFGGEGPPRRGCDYCGGCMVGCRNNGKNSLDKNYLYFAEKRGTEIRPESEVTDIRPLPAGQPDGARYEVVYRHSTACCPNLSAKCAHAMSFSLAACWARSSCSFNAAMSVVRSPISHSVSVIWCAPTARLCWAYRVERETSTTPRE